MKKLITSVSLVAMMASIPSAFAASPSQDCLHHMKEHCAKHHKKCMEKEKEHCKNMETVESNRLNALSIIKNTPHVHYEVRSIFVKGGKGRIKEIDSKINESISASAGNIDSAALKIVPHDKDDYSLSSLTLDLHDMNRARHFDHGGFPPPPPHPHDEHDHGPLAPPPIPSVFGHHQVFSVSDSAEYDLGTPHLTINGGSLSIKQSGGATNITPQEFIEIEETIKHDPEATGLGTVDTIMKTGRSLSIDIPHYETVSESRPIEAIYSFEDKLVNKTGRYKKHDALNVKQVTVSGGVSMNVGSVNAIVMPYSKELHGQDIILVKPTFVLGTPPSAIMPPPHDDEHKTPHVDVH